MPKSLSAAARSVVTERRRHSRSCQTRATCAITEALESRTHLSVSQDANGWTIVAPETDTHIIYVSNSQGNDQRTGRSPDQAVKSLDRAASLIRDHSADQMLLKRGDVWTSQTFDGWDKSGKSEQQPIVIGAYGSGPRPRLNTGAQTAFTAGESDLKHLSLIGIHLSAHTRLPGANFVSTAGTPGIRLVGPLDDLLIEDCYIEGYRDNIMMQAFSGDITDVRIRRSVIVDAYGTNDAHAQGLYSESVSGLLLEENVFDHNGWNEDLGSGYRTGFNHNVYLRADNTDVIVRGNVFANASSHGLQARAGGIVENNLFLDNPIGLSFGLVNGSPATPGGVTGNVNGNVFIGGDDKYIGGAMRGWALELGNTKKGADTVVSNNVFTGTGIGEMPAILLTVGSNIDNRELTAGLNDLTLRNNVIYRWHEGIRVAAGLKPGQSGPDGLNGLVVRDNDFQRLSTESILHDFPFAPASEKWSGNRYDGGSDGKPDIHVNFQIVPWARWKSEREPTAQAKKVQYANPDRTAATYNASLGGADSTQAFIDELRKLSSQNWRPQYTGIAAVQYMHAGFSAPGSVQEPAPPPPTPAPGEPPSPAPVEPGPGEPVPNQPVNPDPAPASPSMPPAAPLASTDLPEQVQLTAGDDVLTFSVTYVDPDAAIDLATIDAGDLRVLGRRGFDQPAALVGVQQIDNAAVAMYAVSQPDGPWERGDRGMYTVMTNADQVRDVHGMAVEPATLAEFKLTVAKAPPPDRPPTVKKLKFTAGRASGSSVTVWFSEDVSSSIDVGDLLLLAEDGARVDPSLMSVTYDSVKHCAIWTFPGLPDARLPKARFRIALATAGIADSIGQALDGDRDGVAGGEFAPPRWFKV